MRISDVSSDVCSSDLCNGLPDGFLGTSRHLQHVTEWSCQLYHRRSRPIRDRLSTSWCGDQTVCPLISKPLSHPRQAFDWTLVIWHISPSRLVTCLNRQQISISSKNLLIGRAHV